MKIKCDVCEKAEATVICCADEAALCAKCDVQIHTANNLASKHQRLMIQCLSTAKLPTCDICQEKSAFIFCVEDRALLCKECDDSIHKANSLTANHQRFLATGIQVALSSNCNDKESSKRTIHKDPPTQKMKTTPHHVPGLTSSSWAVDELLQISDYQFSYRGEQLGFGELAWLSEADIFGEKVSGEALTVAEVPQLSASKSNNITSYRPTSRSYSAHKKPKFEITCKEHGEEDEYFTVPDLG